MKTIHYPFCDNDCLENRNTYFYSLYQGDTFLTVWENQRSVVLLTLPSPIPPNTDVISKFQEGKSVNTLLLLNFLLAVISRGEGDEPKVTKWLDKLVKKFETVKRIHPHYDARFRAVDQEDYRVYPLYIRLAQVFEAAYNNTQDIIYLNVLLKCNDTLCSIEKFLSADEKGELAWLIQRERNHIDVMCKMIRARGQ